MNALGSSSQPLFTAARNLSRGEGISPDSAWVVASVGMVGSLQTAGSDAWGHHLAEFGKQSPRSPSDTSRGEQSCNRQHHMAVSSI